MMQNGKRGTGLAVALVLGILLPLAGCSDHDGRRAVTGNVTLDGQPLGEGMISFQPMPGTKTPSAGGQIVDGQFEIPPDKGLMPGKYRVTVNAFRETGKMINDPQMGRIADVAPVVFNEAGRLEAEVVADAGNQFDFTLTTAK